MRALCRAALLAWALVALASLWAAPAAGEPRSKPLPALTPVRADALTRALDSGRLTAAQYALERARSLFQLGSVRAEFGDVARAEGRDATLVLRDLAVRLRFLSRAERADAAHILARPDDGDVPVGNGWSGSATRATPRCSANPIQLCFHWVTNTADAATSAYVDDVQTTLETVWTQEITTIGYREPLSDATSTNDGGGPELDIYLEDLGGFGVFGYCASDDPNLSSNTVFALSAFCVLDNDYAAVQYGTGETPLGFLQVTAAHEFNHASQFAYDAFEDAWLMEGTATNMEETVFPDVDDNVTFLESSQLRHPGKPLDRSGFSDTEYGAWIFWRYLEEKLYGNNPAVNRRVWERADASTPFAPDDYSLAAARNVLLADGRRFANVYASFGVANRLLDYEDRALYPFPPTYETFRLGPARTTTGWRSGRLSHLTTQFFRFRPGPAGSPTAKLRVDVDLTAYSRATLISRYASAPTQVRSISLGAEARGGLRVPFGRGVVIRVDLVLSNGSVRTSCFDDLKDPPFYSCFGTPLDERRLYNYRAKIVP
jgi:hypothetical protein